MPFQVLTYPRDEKLLRRVARPIAENEFGTQALTDYVGDLVVTMMNNGGIGLAATQVRETPFDDGQPVSMFAMLSTAAYGAICNPMITSQSNWRPGIEGCLSFGSIGETMSAPDLVHIKYRLFHGGDRSGEFTGIDARAVYHEMAHLRGELMIDRMSPLKRGLFLKALNKHRGER